MFLDREFQDPYFDPSVPHLVFIPSSVASPCPLLGGPAPEMWQVISFTHFLHSVQTGRHSFLVSSHAWIDLVTCLKMGIPVFIDGIMCCFYRFGMWELKPVYTHYLDILMQWLQWGVRLRNHKLSLVWSVLFKFTVYSYQRALWLYTFHIYCDSCFVLYIQCFCVHLKFIVVTFNSVFIS